MAARSGWYRCDYLQSPFNSLKSGYKWQVTQPLPQAVSSGVCSTSVQLPEFHLAAWVSCWLIAQPWLGCLDRL